MNLEKIKLISFGYFEKSLLDKIVQEVEHEFMLPVKTKEGHLDLSLFYDPARRQYDGFKLLKEMDSTFAKEKAKNTRNLQCRPFYSNFDLYIRTGLFKRTNRNSIHISAEERTLRYF